MKIKLTSSEKLRTLVGTATFGTVLSLLIGGKIIPQVLVVTLFYYLLTGSRPAIVFAAITTWRRDAM